MSETAPGRDRRRPQAVAVAPRAPGSGDAGGTIAASPGPGGAALAGARAFLRQVVRKADEDNIFFLAGAIAFNVIVAFVPLAIAVLGIAGTILRLQEADPTGLLLGYLVGALPPVSPEFERVMGDLLNDVLARSAGLISVGSVFLVWIATRLIGTVRTVLSEIFDIPQRRGFVSGKLFDLKMVLAAGTLFALNVGLTVGVAVVARIGVDVLGISPAIVEGPQAIFRTSAAFVTLWFMFLMIYRFLPARPIPWRTALVAATFTAVLFEVMKQAFSWYATSVADFSSLYGGYIAMLIILILWIYYSAVVFILGGQVAHVAAMHRVRRRQRERLVT